MQDLFKQFLQKEKRLHLWNQIHHDYQEITKGIIIRVCTLTHFTIMKINVIETVKPKQAR